MDLAIKIIAEVCFILAALSVPVGRVSIGWVGVALAYALTLI